MNSHYKYNSAYNNRKVKPYSFILTVSMLKLIIKYVLDLEFIPLEFFMSESFTKLQSWCGLSYRHELIRNDRSWPMAHQITFAILSLRLMMNSTTIENEHNNVFHIAEVKL